MREGGGATRERGGGGRGFIGGRRRWWRGKGAKQGGGGVLAAYGVDDGVREAESGGSSRTGVGRRAGLGLGLAVAGPAQFGGGKFFFKQRKENKENVK